MRCIYVRCASGKALQFASEIGLEKWSGVCGGEELFAISNLCFRRDNSSLLKNNI